MTLQSLFVLCLKNTDFHTVTRNFARKKGYKFVLCANWDAGKVEINHEKKIVEMSTHSRVDFRKDQFEQINHELPDPLSKDEFAEIFLQCWMLVDFEELYKRVKSLRMMQFITSKPLPTEKRYDDAINDLIDLRNHFIHFVQKQWTILEGHLRTVVLPCMEIIVFLLGESGNIRRDDGKSFRNQTQKIIQSFTAQADRDSHAASSLSA